MKRKTLVQKYPASLRTPMNRQMAKALKAHKSLSAEQRAQLLVRAGIISPEEAAAVAEKLDRR